VRNNWVVMVCCLLSVIMTEGAFSQEQQLITEEDFVRELAPDQASPEPKIRLRSISVEKRPASEIAIHLLFEFGSTELADKFSKKQLQEAGKALGSPLLKKYRFEIAGHTDNVGSDNHNQILSEKRAAYVRQYLVDQYQIDESRLETKGYGESYPLVSNNSEKGRAQNRQVVFRRIEN